MKHILLLGASGQLGRALQTTLAPHGQLSTPPHAEYDLSNLDALRSQVQALRPDVIVNAAAYTAVDRAESEPEMAQAINATAPALLAELAGTIGALLVHFSTDYVFDGAQEAAYTESDTAHPLSVYGLTKLAGEQAIQRSGCHHLILRTSWLYSASGRNFLCAILRRLRQTGQTPVTIVADTTGSPSCAMRVAEASTTAMAQWLPGKPLQPRDEGLFHLTASGHTTWYEYAQYAATCAEQLALLPEGSAARLKPVTTADYPAAAVRPRQSQLDNRLFQCRFNLDLPDWRLDVAQTVAQIARHPALLETHL